MKSKRMRWGSGIEPKDVRCYSAFKRELALQSEHLSLPVFGGQSVNVIKMSVTGSYGKVVLLRRCGDLDVIFRNWSTLFPENILDFSLMLSRCGITIENSVRRCELIHSLNVRFDASGLPCTVIQLAENDARSEHLCGFGNALFDCRIFRQKGDDNIRV
jgi:hypothetical protein